MTRSPIGHTITKRPKKIYDSGDLFIILNKRVFILVLRFVFPQITNREQKAQSRVSSKKNNPEAQIKNAIISTLTHSLFSHRIIFRPKKYSEMESKILTNDNERNNNEHIHIDKNDSQKCRVLQ